MNSHPPTGPEGRDESLDAWMRALRGHGHDIPEDVRQEVEAIRSYLAHRDAAEQPAEADPQRELRMMNYLRAKGAFHDTDKPQARTGTGFLARFLEGLHSLLPRPALMRMAAGLALVALAVPMVVHLVREPEVIEEKGFRGAVDIRTIEAADPIRTAADIASTLASLSVPHRIVVSGDSRRLEAKVSPEQRGRVETALANYQIRVPENGILVIVVRNEG